MMIKIRAILVLLSISWLQTHAFSTHTLTTPHKLSALSASSDNQDPPAVLSAAIISCVSSSIVLWSEASVILTGCGPLVLNDTLFTLNDIAERTAYWIVLLAASSFWFCRLAFQGQSLSTILNLDPKQPLLVAEVLAYVAVLGAVVALSNQAMQGAQMDGLSGIDIEYCKSRQSFQFIL
jgi:hypothetical protein